MKKMAAITNLICVLFLSAFGLSHGDRCPGYTDSSGDYVESLDCPRPDSLDDFDETYCCIRSLLKYNYCCDQDTYDFFNDNDDSLWSSSTTTIAVVVSIVFFILLILAAILRYIVRRNRYRQRPTAPFVAPPVQSVPVGHDVHYHPPPPPHQIPVCPPPMPSAPEYQEDRSDDPPPPYPGYPVPPLETPNESK